MSRLWVFGDSFSAPYNMQAEWSRKYIEYKGYQPKVFADLLSEKLGYELRNNAIMGADNYTIFEQFCISFPSFEDNDIVIIGWSSYYRFRLVTDAGQWLFLHPQHENVLTGTKNVSKQTVDEIIVNREAKNYLDELNNWIVFINAIKTKTKIIQWTPFDIGIKTEFLYGYECVTKDTNFEIIDGHFSENGHKEITEVFLKKIKNKIL
jgi:hypothetical protein